MSEPKELLIDDSIQGGDRKLLEIFYELSERQSFSGWREKWSDCNMALYACSVTIKDDQP